MRCITGSKGKKVSDSGHNDYLELKNPHAVLAAMNARPKDVLELRFYSEPHGLWHKISDLARELRIPVRDLPPAKEKRGGKMRPGPKQERIGNAVGLVRAKQPIKLSQLWGSDQDKDDPRPPLWIALDSLQDPHNVGAIFRSAAFYGVRGIIVSRANSAPINATVHDISAGGVELVPFCVESNLHRALKEAQKAGLWVLGTSEHAKDSIWNLDPRRSWLIAIGNEQKGLRRLTLEKCDLLCTIPGAGPLTSLNATVATGITLSVLSRPLD